MLAELKAHCRTLAELKQACAPLAAYPRGNPSHAQTPAICKSELTLYIPNKYGFIFLHNGRNGVVCKRNEGLIGLPLRIQEARRNRLPFHEEFCLHHDPHQPTNARKGLQL